MKLNLHDNICVKGMMQLCSHAENDIDIYDHGRKLRWNARNALKCESKKEVYCERTKKYETTSKVNVYKNKNKSICKQHFKKSDV